MKKLFLTVVLAIAGFVSAQAQFLVGGNVGVWYDHEDENTSWSILPEFTYYFNDQWSAGTEIGLSGYAFKHGGNTTSFVFNPYARYTFFSADLVEVFCEGAIGFATATDHDAAFSIGLRPGIKVNLSDNWSLISKIGFLGFSSNKDGIPAVAQNGFGFGLNNNIALGLYYSF